MAKKMRFKYRKYMGFFYIGFAFILISSLSFNILRVYREHQNYQVLLEKREALLLEKQKISKEVELLSDDDYVTRYARDNYIFSKDGEEVVKLPESTK